MFTNPFLQQFLAYLQQQQMGNPQMMLGAQMPMYQQPMMGGLLGKAAGDRPGYLAPISGKPVTGGGVHAPRQGDRTMAVRG